MSTPGSGHAAAAAAESGDEPLGFGAKHPTKTRRWVREHDEPYSLYCRDAAEGNPKGEQMELFAVYCDLCDELDFGGRVLLGFGQKHSDKPREWVRRHDAGFCRWVKGLTRKSPAQSRFVRYLDEADAADRRHEAELYTRSTALRGRRRPAQPPKRDAPTDDAAAAPDHDEPRAKRRLTFAEQDAPVAQAAASASSALADGRPGDDREREGDDGFSMGNPEDCEISASQQQQIESDGWAFPAAAAKAVAPAAPAVDAQKERREKVAAQAIRAAEAKAKAEARLASALRESERCDGAHGDGEGDDGAAERPRAAAAPAATSKSPAAERQQRATSTQQRSITSFFRRQDSIGAPATSGCHGRQRKPAQAPSRRTVPTLSPTSSGRKSSGRSRHGRRSPRQPLDGDVEEDAMTPLGLEEEEELDDSGSDSSSDDSDSEDAMPIRRIQ